MAIAPIAAVPFAICAAAATYVTYGLATCFGFDAATRRPRASRN